jgi:hypothetical protein
MLKPVPSSCRLYTGCRLNSKQVTFRLVLREFIALSFDSIFRYLSMRLQRFAYAHLLGTHLTFSLNAFSTVAHHHASLTQQHWAV